MEENGTLSGGSLVTHIPHVSWPFVKKIFFSLTIKNILLNDLVSGQWIQKQAVLIVALLYSSWKLN